jgi:hypothetical protein
MLIKRITSHHTFTSSFNKKTPTTSDASVANPATQIVRSQRQTTKLKFQCGKVISYTSYYKVNHDEHDKPNENLTLSADPQGQRQVASAPR